MIAGIADCQAALAEIESCWNAAARPWNPSALADLYVEDAVFFGGRAGHSVGHQAIRQYFESYAGVIESAHLELVEQRLLRLDEFSFLAQGYGEFSFVLAGNVETRSRLRTTLVVVRTVQGLQIRAHHFSITPEAPPLGQS